MVVERFSVDLNKPLVFQVGYLEESYQEWVHQPIVSKEGPRFFENNVLEFLTRTVWWAVPVIWLPVVCWFAIMSIDMGHSLPQVAIMFMSGISLWTLIEYTLHRFLFHIETKSYWTNTLHYLLHGCHHKHPMDGLRLVFPPAATAILSVPFYNLIWLISTPSTAPAIFGGGLLGYVIYDCTHYYLHHGQPSKDPVRNLGSSPILGFQFHFSIDLSVAPAFAGGFETMPRRRDHDEISERIVKRRVLDRISDLPDEILLHILSFLPHTTERARTSLISRRWRHVWTHDPSIKFFFVDPLTDIDAAAHNYVAAVDSCLRSVNALAIDLFSIHLWLPTPSPPAEIRANARVADRWFRFAGNRSVRRLSVMARTRPGTWSGNCRIPSSIFCCRALTELNVSFSAFPAVPSNFRGFRFLKTLSIGCGTIDNETVADLLPCCPLLESLSLIGCDNLDYVQVSPKDLPNLKRLILFSDTNLSITASIEAPNLEFFNFKGELQELHWTGSKALREAIIRDNGDDVITPDTKDDWMNLVLAVSDVRVLTVNHWFCQFVIPEQNMFKNLKELNCFFDWITGSMLYTFISNLKECLMLEKLYIKLSYETRSRVKDTIKESYCKTQAAIDDFILPKNVFLKTVEDNFEDDGFEFTEHFLQLTLPLHHLRTVTLEEFVGSKYEMFLVKFLLRSAVSLEKFIVFDYLGRDEVRTEEELQLLFAPIPKASSCVQMKLSLMDTWKLPRLLK